MTGQERRLRREVDCARHDLEQAEARLNAYLTDPYPDHCCGASGFGAVGDTCPACDWWDRHRAEIVQKQG